MSLFEQITCLLTKLCFCPSFLYLLDLITDGMFFGIEDFLSCMERNADGFERSDGRENRRSGAIF
jgi:hypothetical protein